MNQKIYKQEYYPYGITIEVKKMDHKTLGWIQIVGGALALLPAGRIGYTGMMGMMGYYGGYNMMSYGGGLGVSVLAIVSIITGIHYVTKTHEEVANGKTKSRKN